jgi:hypothetical protein
LRKRDDVLGDDLVGAGLPGAALLPRVTRIAVRLPGVVRTCWA